MNLTYEQLTRKNPEYLGDYWDKIEALYCGGRDLLMNQRMLPEVLHRWGGETEASYTARKKCAFYENHMGSVIDYVAASLGADPLVLSEEGKEQDGDFWERFTGNVSPPRATESTLSDFMVEQARTALIYGRAWTLVDLPAMAEPLIIVSEAEQREAGLLTPFLVPISPTNVIDWEVDDDGRLLWAMMHDRAERRLTPDGDRKSARERFVLWTPDEWFKYEIVIAAGQKKPSAKDLIAPAKAGRHTFGMVPLIPLALKETFWMGDKLYSLAREHMNQMNALADAKRKSAFQQLYEFLAPAVAGIDTAVNEHQEDSNRGINQPRGPGLVQVRGNGDKAMYIGPDSSGFTFLASDAEKLKESIYRITQQMALSEDNRGALIRRSAESKAIDHSATTIVLRALGRIVRSHCAQVMDATSRGIDEVHNWKISGMDRFDPTSVDSVVMRFVELSSVSMHSETLRRKLELELAKATLENTITVDEMAQIDRELQRNIHPEELTAMGSVLPLPNRTRVAGDEEDEDDETPPKKAAKK